MSYVPNPSDPTEPVASRTVESAAREFREIKGLLARSLSFPAADTPTNRGLLPPAADRAGRVLQFNATTGVPETGATVSSLMAAESNAAASAASAANSAAAAANSASASQSARLAAESARDVASTEAAAAAGSATSANTSSTQAQSSATAAADSATAAGTSATTASASQTAAADSATAAANSATAAGGSATSAATSADSAANSAASAAQITALYLGVQASDPATNLSGGALVQGNWYINSTTGFIRVRISGSWVEGISAGVNLTGDQTIGGVKTFSSTLTAPGLRLTQEHVIGEGNGLYNGNGDAASSMHANLQIRSWFGIGFSPSGSVHPVPQNENAVWINVRTGDLSARGNITAGGQFIGNGAGLTSLPAAQLTGNVAAARITNALNASGSAPIYACRAWVNFDGITGAIRASGNVASVTRHGAGQYTIHFATAMPDGNYAFSGSTLEGVFVSVSAPADQTASAVRFTTLGHNGTLFDGALVSVAIFR